MVAVALMPPLVTFGLLGGAGRWEEASPALTLLATNLICVNLSAIVTFLFHGIYPSASKWRDHRKARRTARIGLVVWGVLLLALLAYHFLPG
jgi:uncharacterized membrane protein